MHFDAIGGANVPHRFEFPTICAARHLVLRRAATCMANGQDDNVLAVSKVPACPDLLPADVAMVPLPDVAERIGVSVTRVHDLLRDGKVLAVRRDGIIQVPELMLSDNGVAKHIPGVISVLRDGGFQDEEILSFLYTEDESLPGRPIDALHGHLAREVMRRAQAMAF